MAFRNIGARFTADTAEYSAGVTKMATETRSFAEQAVAAGKVADKGMRDAAGGTVSYAEAVKVASRTEAEAAQANVAAAAKRRESLEALRAEYVKLAATAEEGSAQQLAALRLQEVATKRLGETTAAVGAEKEAAASAGLLETKLAALAGQNTIVGKGLNEVSQAATGSKLSLMGMSAGTLAAGAGVLALGFLLEQGVKKLSAMGAETRALQRVTGGTAEDTSRFVYELKSVGLTSDAAIAPMARFTRNIQDHAEKFAQAGVAIKFNNDGTKDTFGTYENLRDRLRQTSDAGERQSIIFALMGKGAVGLSADLLLSKERIKEVGEQSDATGHTMSQGLLNDQLALTRATRFLGAELSGFEISLAKNLVPTLAALATDVADDVGWLNKMADAVGLNSTASDKMAASTKHNAEQQGVLGKVVGGLREAYASLAGHGNDVADIVAKRQKEATDSINAKVKAIDDEKIASGHLQPFVDALAESEGAATLEGVKLSEAATKLKVKMEEVGSSIGLSGEQLLEWAGGSAKAAEDQAKAVTAAMDATSKSFSKDFSFTSSFSASSMTKEAQAGTTAVEKLAQAQQNLADKQAEVAAKTKTTVGDTIALRKADEEVTKAQKDLNTEASVSNRLAATWPEKTRETQNYAEALKQANDPMHYATKALTELLTEAGNLSPVQKKIVNFYQDSLIEGKAFSDNIRTAIKQGYDPQLISDLLQKGPKEAGPILQEMISDHTGKLKDFVNAGEKALQDLNANVVESSRLMNIAVNAKTQETAGDLRTAYAIWQAESLAGGTLTTQKLAEGLGIPIGDVERTVNEYGLTVVGGVNQVNAAVGAPPVEFQAAASRAAHAIRFDSGGTLARDSGFQPAGGRSLVQWAEPETQGEYHAFIPRANDHRRPNAVRTLATAADDLGYQLLAKMANGGFIYPSDVPKPPDFSGRGYSLGPDAAATTQLEYDRAVAFVAAHPPAPAGGGFGGGTGTGYGFQALIDYINSKGIANTVTSTVRPGSITTNGNLSEHALGMAADFVGDMPAITAAFRDIGGAMNELIHDPGGSIKRGSPVDSSFWGAATWAQHGNHVHAATFHGPGDGPGVPTAHDGASAGGEAGNVLGGRRVGASIYGGPGDPSSGIHGYHGDDLRGRMAFAELSNPAGSLNFSALGGLPYDARLKIGYNGRTVIGEKLDVGAGGGPVQGLPRAIDLWYETAQALGFDGGLGVVDIAPAAMGGLFRNGKMTTGVMDQGGWLAPGMNLNWNGTGVPERVLPPSGPMLDYDKLAEAVVRHMDRVTIEVGAGEVSQALYQRQKQLTG